MDDAFGVKTSALDKGEPEPLGQIQALKADDAFLVADSWGDLKGGADGLFDDDTRILSQLVLRVGDQRPSRLSSGVSQDNVFFTCHSTNRPLPPMGGRSAPAGVLHLERRRFLWDRRLFERIRVVNHGMEDVLLPLSVDYAADFVDVFQVRGTARAQMGTLHAPAADGRSRFETRNFS
jgi:glycogen debranching enzyme